MLGNKLQIPLNGVAKDEKVEVPPPNWTPTGNSGEWQWFEDEKAGVAQWHWYDDVYGYDSPLAGCSLGNGMKHGKKTNDSWWKRSFKWFTTISE